MDRPRHSLKASWLHWISAALVLAQIPIGKLMVSLPPGEQDWPFRAHVILGLAVLVITVWRVALSRRATGPGRDPRWSVALARAAKLTHRMLYALLLLLALSGIAVLVGMGMAGAFVLPAKGSAAAEVHGLLANVLIALLALHVLAALYHQFWLRDGVFGRIALGPARR